MTLSYYKIQDVFCYICKYVFVSWTANMDHTVTFVDLDHVFKTYIQSYLNNVGSESQLSIF
jgi:hypothetical protein